MTEKAKSGQKRLISSLIPVGIYLSLAMIGMLFHEPWRDELQVWAYAKQADGLFDLIMNNSDIHPPLWYVLVFFLGRIFNNPVSMQVLNVLISATSVFLIWRFSPFKVIQKAGLSFGYFLLFEYALIARAYALGLLLVIAFLVLNKTEKRTYIRGIILFFLALTSLYGVAISFLLLGHWIMADREKKGGSSWIGYSAGLAGILLSAGDIIRQTFAWESFVEGYGQDKLGDTFRGIADVFNQLFYAILPLPDLSNSHWWNTHFLDLFGTAGLVFGMILTLALMLSLFYFFRQDKKLVLFFGSGLLMIYVIMFFAWQPSARHAGHFLILIISAFWLFKVDEKTKEKIKREASVDWLLTILMVMQIPGGMFAFYQDISRPFSNAGTVASSIQNEHARTGLVAGAVDFSMTPVAVHLQKDVFMPSVSGFGSFVDWGNASRQTGLGMIEVLEPISQLAKIYDEDVLVLLTTADFPNLNVDSVKSELAKDYQISNYLSRLELLEVYENGIVEDENYQLFRFHKDEDFKSGLVKPNTVSVQLDSISEVSIEQGIFNFDGLGEDNKLISEGTVLIDGWLLDDSISIDGNFEGLGLIQKNEKLLLEVKRIERKDVNNKFGLNDGLFGFKGTISLDEFESDTFRLGFLFRSPGGELTFFSSGNQIDLSPYRNQHGIMKTKAVKIPVSTLGFYDFRDVVLDSVFINQSGFWINGWAMQTTADLARVEKYVVLVSGDEGYFFDSELILRPDVARSFSYQGNQALGFRRGASFTGIPSGEYQLGIYGVNENGEKVFQKNPEDYICAFPKIVLKFFQLPVQS